LAVDCLAGSHRGRSTADPAAEEVQNTKSSRVCSRKRLWFVLKYLEFLIFRFDCSLSPLGVIKKTKAVKKQKLSSNNPPTEHIMTKGDLVIKMSAILLPVTRESFVRSLVRHASGSGHDGDDDGWSSWRELLQQVGHLLARVVSPAASPSTASSATATATATATHTRAPPDTVPLATVLKAIVAGGVKASSEDRRVAAVIQAAIKGHVLDTNSCNVGNLLETVLMLVHKL
jgi:hypothetical protein